MPVRCSVGVPTGTLPGGPRIAEDLQLTLLGAAAQSRLFSSSKGKTMSTKAASKVERGTKRTCQNSECGSRFYDLGRDPIICPICNTAYSPLAAPVPVASSTRTYQRPVKKAVPEIKPEIAADADSDELPLIDGDEPAEAEGDETLIEEVEEDTPDVAGIIDAPIEPDEKT